MSLRHLKDPKITEVNVNMVNGMDVCSCEIVITWSAVDGERQVRRDEPR